MVKLFPTRSILYIDAYIIYFNPNVKAAWGDIEVYIFYRNVELSELSTKRKTINCTVDAKTETINPV